jgi:hypothetical protein
VLALLEVVTNILSNPVAERLPLSVQPYIGHALAAVVLLLLVDTYLLSRLQCWQATRDPRLRHARSYQLGVFALVLLGVALAAAAGLLSNAVANALPQFLITNATYALGLAILVGLVVAWLVFREENQPSVRATDRANFRTLLTSRYTRQREDALREATLLTLGLEVDPAAVAPPAFASGALEAGALRDTTPVSGPPDILAAFDAAQGRLLILGEPGSGKTTQLVELALGLLGRDPQPKHAHAIGPHLPAPVLVPLASWAINPERSVAT